MAKLDLNDLVSTAREVDAPSADHAAQLFGKLIDGLNAPTGTDPGPVGPSGAESAGALTQGAATVSGAKVVFSIGAFVALGASIALTAGVLTRETPGAAPQTSTQEEASPPTQTPQIIDPEPATDEPIESEAMQAPVRKTKERQSLPSDHLAEEVALIRRAKLALNAKQPSKALALLDDYAQKFPQGALKSEAQATRVLVLCALNQSSKARSAATELSEDSPLGKKMKEGCKVR